MRLLIAFLAGCLAATAAHASALPSFACVFTEPFISIDSFPGGMRFESPESKQIITNPTYSVSGGKIVLGGRLKSGKAFSLTIIKQTGGDGMSDYTQPYTGTLSGTVAGLPVTGGCLKFPDGTTPRPVKGVASNDTLNVRTKPKASASVVNRVSPNAMVWAFPENTVNGWARVTSAKYPPNESGMITVVPGWVNAKFLGAPGSR